MFGNRKREIDRLKAERERLYARIETVEKDAAAHLAVAKRLAGQHTQLSQQLEAERAANAAADRRAAGPEPLVEGGSTGRDVSLLAQLRRSEEARRSLDEQLGTAQSRLMELEAVAGREHTEVPA